MKYQLISLLALFGVCCVSCYDWGGSGTTAKPGPCGFGPVLIPEQLNETVTAELGQVVWQVSVERKNGGTWAHSCGGVIIAKQAVLTSASCVDGTNAGMVRCESGIVDLPKGGFVRKRRFTYPGAMKPGLAYTEAVKIHPDYNKDTFENNLAVIRLATAFDFAKSEGNISNVCMPNDTTASDSKSLFVSGWGYKVDNNPALRPQLQLTSVYLANCTVSVTANEFCAAQRNTLNQCEGDMGGPVYSDNNFGGSRLIGIASRGTNCTKDSPMVYINVEPYMDWILEASKPYY